MVASAIGRRLADALLGADDRRLSRKKVQELCYGYNETNARAAARKMLRSGGLTTRSTSMYWTDDPGWEPPACFAERHPKVVETWRIIAESSGLNHHGVLLERGIDDPVEAERKANGVEVDIKMLRRVGAPIQTEERIAVVSTSKKPVPPMPREPAKHPDRMVWRNGVSVPLVNCLISSST